MKTKPTRLDLFILFSFTILITLHPFFLRGRLNIFELGLYLPNIQAILDGRIPYRDFFHLRGAFELYPPAFLMFLFGEKVAVLQAWFYIGTVLTVLLYVLIAWRIYETRLLLYLMVPVFIARTFPRVVFTYWGGMRFALGALAILLAVEYSRRREARWLLGAGLASGVAFLTSSEVGVSAFGGIAGAVVLSLIFDRTQRKQYYTAGIAFLSGFLVVNLFYGLYLASHEALTAFMDSVWGVAVNMERTFPIHTHSHAPHNPVDAFLAAVNPESDYFKHMTPAYLYLFLGGYFFYRLREKKTDPSDFGIFALAIYGLTMYISAFRNIEASQFEMALQPEKLLLFYLLEKGYLSLKERKEGVMNAQAGSSGRVRKMLGVNVLIALLILSSLGYAIHRYNHRFFMFKYLRNKLIGRETASLIPSQDVECVNVKIDRLRGNAVPVDQAEDFNAVVSFIREQSHSDEPVLLFPELGFYSFLLDRPFVGRFSMATFAWMDDRWQQEFFSDIRLKKPKFVITDRALDSKYEKIYFQAQGNKEKYDQIVGYIEEFYQLVKTTPSLQIYQVRE